MTKKELIESLAPYPDGALIYVESDHGQVPEQSGGVAVSKDEELPFTDMNEEIAWRDINDVKNNNAVTAILL